MLICTFICVRLTCPDRQRLRPSKTQDDGEGCKQLRRQGRCCALDRTCHICQARRIGLVLASARPLRRTQLRYLLEDLSINWLTFSQLHCKYLHQYANKNRCDTRHTRDIKMHSKASCTQRVTFRFQTAARIDDVFATVLYDDRSMRNLYY